MNKQKGIAQIAIMIIMLVLAVALPITTRLVQKSQENRGKAAGELGIDKEDCKSVYAGQCEDSCSPGYTQKKDSSGNLLNCSWTGVLVNKKCCVPPLPNCVDSVGGIRTHSEMWCEGSNWLYSCSNGKKLMTYCTRDDNDTVVNCEKYCKPQETNAVTSTSTCSLYSKDNCDKTKCFLNDYGACVTKYENGSTCEWGTQCVSGKCDVATQKCVVVSTSTDAECVGHGLEGFCTGTTYLRCESGKVAYRLADAAACKTSTPTGCGTYTTSQYCVGGVWKGTDDGCTKKPGECIKSTASTGTSCKTSTGQDGKIESSLCLSLDHYSGYKCCAPSTGTGGAAVINQPMWFYIKPIGTKAGYCKVTGSSYTDKAACVESVKAAYDNKGIPTSQTCYLTETDCKSAEISTGTGVISPPVVSNICSSVGGVCITYPCAEAGVASKSGTCSSGYNCCEKDLSKICVPLTKECSGTSIRECTNQGSWSTYYDCGAVGCNQSTKTCNSPACVANTEKQCVGNTLQTCNLAGTGWTSKDCGLVGCNSQTKICNPPSVGGQTTSFFICNYSAGEFIKKTGSYAPKTTVSSSEYLGDNDGTALWSCNYSNKDITHAQTGCYTDEAIRNSMCVESPSVPPQIDNGVAFYYCNSTTKQCVSGLFYSLDDCRAKKGSNCFWNTDGAISNCNSSCNSTSTTCARCAGSLGSKGDAGKCDGKVDELDFAAWLSEYQKGAAVKADFDCSGSVDIHDFSLWNDTFIKQHQ